MFTRLAPGLASNMLLLDTNHCTRLMEGDAAVVEALRQHGPVLTATSVIVAGELRFMTSHSSRRDSNRMLVEALLRQLRIYEIDEETAEVYGDLKAEVYARFGPKEKAKRRRTRIIDLGFSDNDLWIGATAIRHGLTIVSSDTDFQRLTEVHPFPVETW